MQLTISDRAGKVALLKARVLALYPFPENWLDQYMEAYPKATKARVIQVKNTYVVDEAITENMESLFGKEIQQPNPIEAMREAYNKSTGNDLNEAEFKERMREWSE
jgi:hypothetical protein